MTVLKITAEAIILGTDKTMTKRTKGQTLINKTPHRKLKIEMLNTVKPVLCDLLGEH
jgi:hypothetical protein